MAISISQIQNLCSNNKKVFENYFFMTVLQILNSLFYLLIYPFLIHTLGVEQYGLYVFAMSIIAYFSSFINFGFDLPAVKEIAQNINNLTVKRNIFSSVLISKIYLELISLTIFIGLVLCIPLLRQNYLLYCICFSNTIVNIIFPTWYFQGIQKMKLVTYLQLGLKLISLPFIFILIKENCDLILFAGITSIFNIIGGILAYFIITSTEKISLQWINFNEICRFYKEASPFFASNAMNIIKQQGATIIIGSFFAMRDVALYDLANKIFTVPTTLTANINGALFPKIITNVKTQTIKWILKFETIIGIFIVFLLAIVGKLIISTLGGSSMLSAYPILIILSLNILTPLLVGIYCNFIFIPHKLYKKIATNQAIAFFSFFIFVGIGLLVSRNVLIVPLSMLLSGISELIFCNTQIYKYKLF